MSHKNLCLYTLLLCAALFFIELLFVNTTFSTTYPLQIITIGTLLFIPLSWWCILPLIFLASANSAIYNLSTVNTIIFLLTLSLLAPTFQKLFLPRLGLFVVTLMAASLLFLLTNHPLSTTISWYGILAVVLLGALLWNMVRKTIAGEAP
ncbi:MAG: hypothetical protein UV79_C0019G0002 [candidate division TM6 bacterium GW2011_GWF2_43_17]|nr:MAG: hypothetical protein UV79_C0019G0002 [candidate division TM6 bacterium GW2011_GWF2_43_17]